jgi:glutamate-5-semialdehyde dehydrogenase
MAAMQIDDIHAYMAHVGATARVASGAMARAATAAKDQALKALALRLREAVADLAGANARDLETARRAGLAEPLVDRLRLTPAIIETVAQGCEQLAAMADPIGDGLRASAWARCAYLWASSA